MSSFDPLCERTRAWTSLDLDGDLAEVERMLLEEHVRHCSACADVVGDLRRLTAVVRSAPAERPERRLVLPSRRRPLAVRALAAVAVIALAAGLGLLGSSLGRPSTEPPTITAEIALLPPGIELERTQLRRLQLNAPKQPVAPPGRLANFV